MGMYLQLSRAKMNKINSEHSTLVINFFILWIRVQWSYYHWQWVATNQVPQ